MQKKTPKLTKYLVLGGNRGKKTCIFSKSKGFPAEIEELPEGKKIGGEPKRAQQKSLKFETFMPLGLPFCPLPKITIDETQDPKNRTICVVAWKPPTAVPTFLTSAHP